MIFISYVLLLIGFSAECATKDRNLPVFFDVKHWNVVQMGRNPDLALSWVARSRTNSNITAFISTEVGGQLRCTSVPIEDSLSKIFPKGFCLDRNRWTEKNEGLQVTFSQAGINTQVAFSYPAGVPMSELLSGVEVRQ